MNICKVKGNVVSTNKSERLNGLKLMLVSEVDIKTGKEKNVQYVAIDTVGAGEGEIVLVVSGSSSRQTEMTENKPIDAAIIGIIDYVEIEGTTVFEKYKPNK